MEEVEQFSRIMGALGVGVWSASFPEGKLKYFSPAFNQILGQTPEVLVGLPNWLDAVVYPDDRPRLKWWLAHLRYGQPSSMEIRVVWPDGSVHPVELRATITSQPNGKAIIQGAVCPDPTARLLNKTEKQQALLFEHLSTLAPVGIIETDITGHCLYANPYLTNMLGRSAEELRNLSWVAVVHPDDCSLIMKTWEETARNRRESRLDYRIINSSGQPVWVSVAAATLYSNENVPIGFAAIVADVDPIYKANTALRQSERAYRLLMNSTSDVITTHAADGTVLVCSDAAKRVFGYEPAEFIGQNPFDFCHPEDRLGVERLFRRALGSAQLFHHRFRIIRKNGRYSPVESTIRRLPENGGTAGQLIAVTRDATKQQRIEARNERLAGTDPLTGLANRRDFERIARRILRRANRAGVLIVFDSNCFKVINDTYGHAFGDEYLTIFAKRMKTKLRSADVVARLGGDEFAALLSSVTNSEEMDRLLKRIDIGLSEPVVINDVQLDKMACSIGYTFILPTDRQLTTVLERADQMLYQAKEAIKEMRP